MIISLVHLVIILVIGGLIYYLITLLPLPEPVKTIIYVIAIIILILVLIVFFFGGTVVGDFNLRR